MAMYIYLYQHNLLYEYYPEGHSYKRYYTKELIESIVKQYPKKIDLFNGDKNLYNYLLRNKLLYDYYPKERNGESFLKK